ncbi:hypothetical protein ASZ90_001153 [hydrocarbon metagenome]|uniref:Uncharacterized protein n=1 Tax=hydrocarbon metagenome TaxID=938273 RepID=A0A0W8G774_9ZZZZ
MPSGLHVPGVRSRPVTSGLAPAWLRLGPTLAPPGPVLAWPQPVPVPGKPSPGAVFCFTFLNSPSFIP